MLKLTKPDKAAYPIDIIILGAYAVMLVLIALTHLIKQAHRFKQWPFSRLAEFDRIFSTVHVSRMATKSSMARTTTEIHRANNDLKQAGNHAKLLSTSR